MLPMPEPQDGRMRQTGGGIGVYQLGLRDGDSLCPSAKTMQIAAVGPGHPLGST